MKKCPDLQGALRAATVHTSTPPGTQAALERDRERDAPAAFMPAETAYAPEFVLAVYELQAVFREKKSKGLLRSQRAPGAAAAGSAHAAPPSTAPAPASMRGSTQDGQPVQAHAAPSDNAAEAAQNAMTPNVTTSPAPRTHAIMDVDASFSSHRMPSPQLRSHVHVVPSACGVGHLVPALRVVYHVLYLRQRSPPARPAPLPPTKTTT